MECSTFPTEFCCNIRENELTKLHYQSKEDVPFAPQNALVTNVPIQNHLLYKLWDIVQKVGM
jgi:hypothetical protein